MSRKKKTEDTSNEIFEKLDQIASSIELTDIPEYMVDSYHKYLSYIVSGRVVCNIFDGFKNIYRRILFAANQLCKDHFVKSARLTGLMYSYSPHGDSYSSIVKAVNHGYLIGQGNFGNLFAVEPDGPGAARYTEVKINPLSETLYLNKELLPYVPYLPTESSKKDDVIMEPLFLPVLLPGIFVGLHDTTEFDNNMALKLSIVMPRYTVLSLLNYVLKYLKEGLWDPTLLYYQYHNIVKQANTDVKASFDVEFGLPAKEDEKGNVHLLSTLPLTQMASKLSSIPFIDQTSFKTDIMFPKKYYSTGKFKKKIKFNTKAYKLINNDYENVTLHDYPIRYAITIILNTLKTFLYPKYFQDQEQKLLDKISEYELLKVVRTKYVDQHIPYDQMSKEEQAVAAKHYSSTFMTIEKKITDFNNDLINIRKRSQNIDKEILNLYEDAFIKTSKYITKYYKDNKIEVYDVTNI